MFDRYSSAIQTKERKNIDIIEFMMWWIERDKEK